MDSISANRVLHARLAPTYEIDEPHNREENKSKVRSRINDLTAKLGENLTIADMGCGTGFILELLPKRFTRLIGIDTTPEMLEILSSKLIPGLEILERSVYHTGLPDSSVDFVTGYSVLDHFENPLASIKEAARILKPGGCLYMDLIPNGTFWRALRDLTADSGPYDQLVQREIDEVVKHAEKMATRYGISAEVLEAAEPHKETGDGFTTAVLTTWLELCKFRDISVNHEWFLGEGHVFHKQSPFEATTISQHLQRLLPMSSLHFKYLWFAAYL